MIQIVRVFCLTSLWFSSSFPKRLRLLDDRDAHEPRELATDEIAYLSQLSNTSHFEEALNQILVERYVGSEGHETVYRYITDELTALGWAVETDEFTAKVPLKEFGVLTFKNIIATLNPNADRFLVLACHYDSKYFSEFRFLGATDSAVPCAMLLNMAHVLKSDFEQIKSNTDLSLQLVFFDGEEAFKTWSPKDSIYGARNLATKWDAANSLTKRGEMVSTLNRIDLLVLLDLIGMPDIQFYNFFDDTVNLYLRLASAEDRLNTLSLLGQKKNGERYFLKKQRYSSIEDDHLPFLQRSVPILHLIAMPFPSVWHLPTDNREALDVNTIEDLNKIMRVFVAEYLHIPLNQ